MSAPVFGLLGRRLGHSWSVPIHKAFGCADYRLIELEPEALAGFFEGSVIGGVNVTIPYKKQVMAFCDELTPEARAIGSVNTLFTRDGKLVGANTDIDGFRYMAKRAGVEFAGKKVVIFGSGGASLTAQYAAREAGAGEVIVVSRSGDNNYVNLSKHADAQIIVNATPLGMYPDCGASPAELSGFPACEGVLELIYNPRRTALLMQAQERGLPCSDGLPMLVCQAAKAQELFFGSTIPEELVSNEISRLERELTNIVLIGMPGSGKSTVGAALAKLTGREALDTDALIEQKTGKSPAAIIEGEGEAAFRSLERETVAELGRLSGKIIITGGGVVTNYVNYVPLRQNGRIYELRRELSLLPTQGRPLSQGADLRELFEKRRPLYERFRDAQIKNDRSPEAAAGAILEDFNEHFSD